MTYYKDINKIIQDDLDQELIAVIEEEIGK